MQLHSVQLILMAFAATAYASSCTLPRYAAKNRRAHVAQNDRPLKLQRPERSAHSYKPALERLKVQPEHMSNPRYPNRVSPKGGASPSLSSEELDALATLYQSLWARLAHQRRLDERYKSMRWWWYWRRRVVWGGLNSF